jgi:hypothetical protein
MKNLILVLVLALSPLNLLLGRADPAAENRYPRKLQLFANGSKAISARVVNLSTAPPHEGLLVPPRGAIERRHCAGMKHSVPIKTPDPVHPKSASQNELMGDTTLAMAVLGMVR